MNHKEILVELVRSFLEDKSFIIDTFYDYKNDMRYSSEDELGEINTNNISNIIEGTARRVSLFRKELYDKLFPHIECDDIKKLNNHIHLLNQFKIDDIKASLFLNAKLMEVYSIEKYLIYKKLKEKLKPEEIELINPFFKDVIQQEEANLDIKEIISYSYILDRSIVMQHFNSYEDHDFICDRFKHVFYLIKRDEDLLRQLKVQDILSNHNNEKEIKIIFINAKDNELIKFFMQRAIPFFPQLRKIFSIEVEISLLKNLIINTVLDYELKLSSKKDKSNKI